MNKSKEVCIGDCQSSGSGRNGQCVYTTWVS